MKIVRIIARLNVGGPAKHVTWLTAGLNQLGHRSILVTGTVPEGEEDMGYFALACGVEPVYIPEMSREISLKDLITIWKLYQLFRLEEPDLIHTHTAKAGTVGRIAGLLYQWLPPRSFSRRVKCRFVHTYHGHIFHSYYGVLKTKLFLGIERLLAWLATDRIIVLSKQQFQEIHGRFGVGRSEQFVITPLGLDLNAFNSWSEGRLTLRKELKISEDKILIGIVGRLTEVKNHKLFLQAAALYKDRIGSDKVQFLIIGDGHLREELEEYAKVLGLNSIVKFLGMRTDPETFYPALDIVALTSFNEGTPLTLLEAMANARPVVATSVGGVVDLLGEDLKSSNNGDYSINEHGILVKPNDAESFCNAIIELVEDRDLRESIGLRGRLFVETHYSKERLISDIATLYDELLKPSKQVSGSLDIETV
jgi:glycosyltransferase involved in cell wall biosynthesis